MMQTSTHYAFFDQKEVSGVLIDLTVMSFHPITVGLSLHACCTNEPLSTTTKT